MLAREDNHEKKRKYRAREYKGVYSICILAFLQLFNAQLSVHLFSFYVQFYSWVG